jgi:hypothetical protein
MNIDFLFKNEILVRISVDRQSIFIWDESRESNLSQQFPKWLFFSGTGEDSKYVLLDLPSSIFSFFGSVIVCYCPSDLPCLYWRQDSTYFWMCPDRALARKLELIEA